MSKAEKAFVVFYLAYAACYAPFFFMQYPSMEMLAPFHTFGMLMGIPLLVIPFRDLYKRDFPDPNSKVTWTIAMLFTGGIGLFVYIFKHGFKPRVPISPESRKQGPREQTRMSKAERVLAVIGLAYVSCYLIFFICMMATLPGSEDVSLIYIIVPLHLVAFVLNCCVLVIAFRDLYRRDFPDPSAKITWAILILATMNVGTIAYFMKYAFKPRLPLASTEGAESRDGRSALPPD